MRVLFSTNSGLGHFHPLVPLARALERAGHETAVACRQPFDAVVEAAGLRACRVGRDPAVLGGAVGRAIAEMNAIDGLEARMEFGRRRVFVDLCAKEVAESLLALCVEWKPDLVVRDALEFGSWAVAERLDVPHASVEVGAFWSAARWRQQAGRELEQLVRSVGLREDHAPQSLYRYLHVTPFPPGFRRAEEEHTPAVRAFRFDPFDSGDRDEAPPWIDQLSKPAVYATLGSSLLRSTPGVFEEILGAFDEEGPNLVMTIGADGDPSRFGPQPQNVRIERYVPQTWLLPHVDLVISHAGQGTVLGGLAHGVPQLALPLGADQPEHARRVAASGVGLMLTPEQRTAAAIRVDAQRLLGDTTFGARANELRSQLAALPPLEAAITQLERMSLKGGSPV